jgi:hypothetical protein
MTEKRKFNPLFPTLIMGAGRRPTYFKMAKNVKSLIIFARHCSNTFDSETTQNIETGTELGPVRRSTRQKTQFTDRESVGNEEIYRQQRTLGGHQGRITALVNQLSTCFTKGRGPDEIVDILESLEKAWKGYNNAYGKYLSKNLAEEEFAQIKEVFSYNNKNHASCIFEAQEYLRYCQSMALQQQATAQRQSISSK